MNNVRFVDICYPCVVHEMLKVLHVTTAKDMPPELIDASRRMTIHPKNTKLVTHVKEGFHKQCLVRDDNGSTWIRVRLTKH